jgi:nucleoid DNA-binding protein
MGVEIGIIADLLFQGRTVQLRGFGTFYPKTRKERPGYDMQRKVPVTIPKRIVALFSPAPNMKKTDGL